MARPNEKIQPGPGIKENGEIQQLMFKLEITMIKLHARYSAREFLKVMILEERGLSQKWPAQKLDCAERKISEICNNKRGISAQFAIELEKVFGISAEFWVTLQAKWDLFSARKKVT